MNYRPRYNHIHDVSDITDDSDVIVEPVTVAEMKNFLRLDGFEDDDESGEMDFTSDDELIAELITASREGIEKWCGISIVRHRWQVLLTNENGSIELPYSNNMTLVSIKNCEDEDIETDDYTIRGTSFKYLSKPYYENMTLVYDAGYDEDKVPKRLKQAIMRDVAYHYENRNDEPGKIAEQAMVLASAFKRVSTWLA